MGWLPLQGQRVIARQFGEAIVRKVTRTAALVRLEKLGVEVEVPLDALQPEESSLSGREQAEGSGSGAAASPPAVPERGLRGDPAKRRAVEALRFGLVPETEIETLTLGYEELQSWVLSRLPHAHGGSPQVSEVCGPFGTGKSHTTAAVRYISSEQGYVTARVEVDGKNVTLSNPERLLYTLWSSLGAKGFESATPILHLCLKAIDVGHPAPSVAPVGIDRVRDNYSTARLIRHPSLLDSYGHALDAIMASSDEFVASQVAHMISSDPNVNAFDVRVRRMIGQRVMERPYDFVEAWVGYAVLSKLAGYKGLVITVDEFEVERLLVAFQFSRVSRLLEVLAAYFQEKLDHPKAPLSVFFATIGEEGHDGDQFVDRLIEEAGGSYYPIKPWSHEDRAELSRRIFRLYSEAYEIDSDYAPVIPEVVEKTLEVKGAGGNGLIRAFIKSYVGALDSLHGPHS